MQRKSHSLALALMLAATPMAFAQSKADKAAAAKAPPAASATATTKVSVNGVMIPQSAFDAMNREREAAGQPGGPEIVAAIKDELINREVLSQAARKAGVDRDPAIASQMEMARQAVLIRALFDSHVKANPISDASLKASYDSFVGTLGNTEYKARHILVKEEAEAKAIVASLSRGDDFAKLAKEKTLDTGSKESGGELDWSPANRYVPEFGEALKKLGKGQTTDVPVKTQYGFHIIRMDDSRALKAPAFEEMKENIRQRAQQEQVGKFVKDLRDKAVISDK